MSPPTLAKLQWLRRAVLGLFILQCLLILLRAGRFDFGAANKFGSYGGLIMSLLVIVPIFLALRLPFQIAILIVFAGIYTFKAYALSVNPFWNDPSIADYLQIFYGRLSEHDLLWDQVGLVLVIPILALDLITRLARWFVDRAFGHSAS